MSGTIPSPRTLRVLNWNMLADLYVEAPSLSGLLGSLALESRKPLMLEKFRSVDADIVALQEVTTDVYKDCLVPEMARLGYHGIFQQKKREPLFCRGKYNMEGCATFYKASNFKLVEKTVVDYDKSTLMRMADAGRSDRKIHRLIQGNIALLLLLEDLRQAPATSAETGDGGGSLESWFVVANTDLFESRGMPDVKLWQAYLLLATLSESEIRDIPMLLCGGFNSTPESAVFECLCHGSVRGDHQHLREDPCELKGMGLIHGLDIASAFEVSNDFYTKCTVDQRWVLDYIWFSRSSLSVVDATTMDCRFEESFYICSRSPERLGPCFRELKEQRNVLIMIMDESDFHDDDEPFQQVERFLCNIEYQLNRARGHTSDSVDMQEVVSEWLGIIEPVTTALRQKDLPFLRSIDITAFLARFTADGLWERMRTAAQPFDDSSHLVRSNASADALWPSDHVAMLATFVFTRNPSLQ